MDRRIKVVHLTSVHSPFDSRIFQKECLSLKEGGYDVSIVAPHPRDEEVYGIRIIPSVKYSNRLQRIFLGSRAVVRRGVEEAADVYHLHDPELLLWRKFLIGTGAVVIYDMHEDLSRQIQNKFWIPKIIRSPLSWAAFIFERYVLREMPVVYAEKTYGDTRPWVRESVEVLNYPKLDWLDDLDRSGNDSTGQKIGYIGAVTKERGSVRMLKALARIQENGWNIGFDCIGPITPAHRDALEEIIRRDSISGVSLPGYMSPADGWARMAKCSVGLAVLEPIPNYVGSYPTKMFEYMAMGIPVIVSDFPIYKRIVEEANCGIAVNPQDTGAVANAISFMLENPERAREMGAKGKESALRHYDWKSEKEKLLGLYKGLLSENEEES